MSTDKWSETFPGGKLVWQGLADFQAGRCTVPACLISIAQTRLSRAGLLSGPLSDRFPEPERQLYRLLCQEGADAYSRYNSLLRELVSFENALDAARQR